MVASGLLLSDDLIFSSRIQATARAQGLTLISCRSLPVLLEKVKVEKPTCIILDLQFPELRLQDFVDALQLSSNPRITIVAYGSHVATESLKAARQAGCHVVLPRSQFVEKLESDIKQWLQYPVTSNDANPGRQSGEQN